MDKDVIKLLSKLLEIIGIIDEHIIKKKAFINEEIYINKKSEIKQNYISLNSKNIIEIFDVLNKNLSDDTQMHIFLLSILLKCTHDVKILDQIIEIISLGNISPYLSTMLEYEIAVEIFTNNYSEKAAYELRRKLHTFNGSTFKTILEIPDKYICKNDRQTNRIVVITEQLLNVQHAPSKIILEQCYTLQKGLGMEVLLIVCPTNINSNDQTIWSELKYQNYTVELNGNNIVTFDGGEMYYQNIDLNNKFIINYKDISIKGKQVLFEDQFFESHKNIMKEIYEFNPMFVYNIASIHPIADLCKNFTTVVASTMNYGYPVSDAQILLCLDNNTDIELNDNKYKVLSPYNQVVLKHKLQFTVEEPRTFHNRIEFKIPEDDFVIAIVGNRLSLEITDEFIDILTNILVNDLRISILLIGGYNNYQKDFYNEIFKNRIHYIGFQPDLVSVISIADLYLNPPRKGGGTSALISLYAGVPVITLPDCDVAGNVGEQFICNNYNEMIALINRYKSDNEFYNKQREWGVEYTHQLSDSAANLKETITRINQVIMDMEKELAICR